MRLDTKALCEAQELFVDLLRSEAKQQHAYVAVQHDGSVSLELEGVDFGLMIRAVVSTYLDHATQTAAPARVTLTTL
jgi:hypothetical protein